MNDLITQWDGFVVKLFLNRRPICLALWTHDDEEKEVNTALSRLLGDDRFTLIIYKPDPKHSTNRDFPVNLLRNICIRNIRTSHFVTLDVDMWPTSGFSAVVPCRIAARHADEFAFEDLEFVVCCSRDSPHLLQQQQNAHTMQEVERLHS